MFFGGQTHLVHDTKCGGVVGSVKFSKIPLSDHGVHLKGLQTPHPTTYMLCDYMFNCYKTIGQN